MAESIMGIEIGSNNIKIIEIIKRAATLGVQKFSLIDTPPDCVSNGVINNAEPIRRALLKEIQAKKYKAKKVVVVVQSSNIIIRNATMEKQPEKMIRQMLELRTEEYLPVEKGQYQIDYKIIKEIEEEGVVKNELLLVAAPNSVVLPTAELIKSLKKDPVLITIPSEALGFVFGADRRMIYEAVGNLVVLDIGGRSTVATVIAKDQAVLTRTIDFGVENINEAINESLGGQEKPENVDDKEYEQYLSDIIRPQIEYSIIAELERILQFYYSSFENSPIKKIYLIGGGANIKGIRTYIRDALNIPTEKLNEFSTVVENPGIEFEPYRRFFVNILGAINGL